MKSLTRFIAHSPASFSDLRASVTARAGTLSPPSRACQVGKGDDGLGLLVQRRSRNPGRIAERRSGRDATGADDYVRRASRIASIHEKWISSPSNRI